MRNLIIGVSLLALAGTAVAQVTPAPDAAAIAPTPVDAAAAQRAADAEKAAAKDRAAAEERMNDQAAQAEKDRAAAEKSAKEQDKAAAKQQAAADKAAAERAAADKAAEKAAAEKAAAASTAATAAAPTGDARDVATQVCLAEAKSRATAVGATNVTMNEVKDTDKKSDGRASVTAKVNVITTDSKGKIKAQKKTIKCETRNGVVTKFKWD
jgi:hypothetical protein